MRNRINPERDKGSLCHQIVTVLVLILVAACSQKERDKSGELTRQMVPTGTMERSPFASSTHDPISTSEKTLQPTLSPTLPASQEVGGINLDLTTEIKYENLSDAVWSPDSQSIALSSYEIAGDNNWTSLYDINSRREVWRSNVPSLKLIFDPNGKIIIGISNQVQIREVNSGQTKNENFKGNAELDMVYLPNGKDLLFGQSWFFSEDNMHSEISLWQIGQKSLIPILEEEAFLQDIAISVDGKTFATAYWFPVGSESRHQIIVWDMATSEKKCAFVGERVIFNPTNESFAGFDKEGKISLYNLMTCQAEKVFQANSSLDFVFSFSPDGKILAFPNSTGDEIELRNTQSGELIYQMRKLPGHIKLVSFSPSGKFLFGLFEDYMKPNAPDRFTLQIWEIIPD